MRRNVLWLLALVVICGFAARWLVQPAGIPHIATAESLPPWVRLLDRNLTLSGIRPGISSSELVQTLGSPPSASGRLLKFAEGEVVLGSDSRVVRVRGTGLRQNGEPVRAGGDPKEVMQALPGFTVLRTPEQGGGWTTLYWPDSHLRVDLVMAVDYWSSTYTLATNSMIRTLPKGVEGILPF